MTEKFTLSPFIEITPPDTINDDSPLRQKGREMYLTIFEQQRKAEEECITGVLTQALKRELLPSDLADCKKAFLEGEFHRFQLMYKGISLGWIERKIDGFNYSVLFTPNRTSA